MTNTPDNASHHNNDDQDTLFSQSELESLLNRYINGELDTHMKEWVSGLLDKYPEYMALYTQLSGHTPLDSDMDTDELDETVVCINEVEIDSTETTTATVSNSIDSLLEESVASVGDDLPDMWSTISDTLTEDANAPVADYNDEYISAYYDQELLPEDPSAEEFEQQLFNNDEANQVLAVMSDTSETVRQFYLRIEENCTLDITTDVMATYAASPIEETETTSEAVIADDAEAVAISDNAALLYGNILDEDVEIDAKVVTLSAYIDDHLLAKDRRLMVNLLEDDAEAKSLFLSFSSLSQHLQAHARKLEQQVPDFWPEVAEQLEAQGVINSNATPLNSTDDELFLDDNVASFSEAKKKRAFKKRWLALPLATAAAVGLLVFGGVPNLNPSPQATQIAAYSSNLPARDVVARAEMSNEALEDASEQPSKNMFQNAMDGISSLLGGNKSAERMEQMLANGELDESDLSDMDRNTIASLPSSGSLGKAHNNMDTIDGVPANGGYLSEDVASNSPNSVPIRVDGRQSPSAEAYLFKTLQEDMPEDEVRVIMGL